MIGLSLCACQTGSGNPNEPYRDPYRSGGAAYPYPVSSPYGYPSGAYVIVPEQRENIQERIERSQDSIDRAVAKGKLTESEAQSLNKELDGIVSKADAMKGDGRVSHREREQISHDLDRLQKNIKREKRDDERRNK